MSWQEVENRLRVVQEELRAETDNEQRGGEEEEGEFLTERQGWGIAQWEFPLAAHEDGLVGAQHVNGGNDDTPQGQDRGKLHGADVSR